MSKKHIKVDESDVMFYDEAVRYLDIDEYWLVDLLNKNRLDLYKLDKFSEKGLYLSTLDVNECSHFFLIENEFNNVEYHTIHVWHDLYFCVGSKSELILRSYDACNKIKRKPHALFFLKSDIEKIKELYDNNNIQDLFDEHDENIYDKCLKLEQENEALRKQIEQLQAGKKEKAVASDKEEIASSAKPTIAAVIKAILEIDSIDELHEFQACFGESGSAKGLEYFILDKNLKKSNGKDLNICNNTARKLINIVKSI